MACNCRVTHPDDLTDHQRWWLNTALSLDKGELAKFDDKVAREVIYTIMRRAAEIEDPETEAPAPQSVSTPNPSPWAHLGLRS